MPKQTGSIDLKAAKTANDDARKVADNYLATDSSGIMIYDGSNGIQTPSNPLSTTQNVFIDQNSLDIRKGTTVLATFGADVAQIGENNYAHIEITSDFIQGKGITNKSFFDFNGNGTTIEIPLSQSRSYNSYSNGEYFIRFVEFNELPVESRTIILDQVPISINNYEIDISLDIYAASTNKHTIYWNLQIQPGVAGTFTSQNYGFIDSSTTYNIQATYDGDKTISNVVLIINGTASSNYGIHALKVNYYATTSSPTYTLGDNISSGAYSFAVGDSSSATGNYSYAQGKGSRASNECSYAIGRLTVASGSNSQAMGIFSQATADNAFASGYNTIASGLAAMATGWETQAKGNYSSSFGYYTEARGVNQTVIGVGNDPDTSSLFIIGNGSVNRDSKTGTITVTPSNALTVDTSGNTTIAGTITMNNSKYLRLNSGAGSSYSWNQIWSSMAAQSGHNNTSNLYLQADGYMGFYVGNDTTTPTGRMYLFYDYLQVSGYVIASDGYRAPNAHWYFMANSSGTQRQLMGLNASNQYFFGYGSYNSSEGSSYFDGNAVYIRSKGYINTVGSGLRPNTANGGNLGTPDNPWNQVVVGSGNFFRTAAPGAYSQTYAACWHKTDGGNYTLIRPSSSRKYKKDIEDISNDYLDPHKLYDLRVVQFRYKEREENDPNNSKWNPTAIVPGFIAEEMAEVYPAGGVINENDEIDDWDLRTVVPPMLKLIQEQHEEIEVLKTEIRDMKERGIS